MQNNPSFKIEESKEFYKTLIQNIGFDVTLLDQKGNILYFNEARDTVLGYDSNTFVEKNWISLIHPEDREYFESLLERVVKVKHLTAQCRVKRKNDTWAWIEFFINSVGSDEEKLVLISFRDVSETISSQKTSHAMAYYDNLTGIVNRSLFRDRLVYSLSTSKRNNKKIGLLYINLEPDQKKDNDELLKQMSEKLVECFRASDTVGRQGGNRFSAILLEQDDIEGPIFVAKKVIRTMSKPFNLRNQEIKINASIGVALYPDDSLDSEQLIIFAENAMNDAIKEGENIHKVHGDL